MIRKIKKEIRILGFDDAAFELDVKADMRNKKLSRMSMKNRRAKDKPKVPVIGVIYRGGNFLDGALRTDITVDGLDSTEQLIKLINGTRHKRQLRVIMLDGITVGGFNIIDIQKLNEKTGIPVIVYNRKMPDLERVRKALKNFKDYKKRWVLIERAGDLKEFKLKRGKKTYSVYYQSVGLSDKETEEIIKLSSTHGQIPEPLRIAHIIATAVVKGESAGRA